MDHTFHYLAMANHAMFQKKLILSLKETELTLGQPKVLDYLQYHDGANQKDMAAGCHIEAPSLTSILNRMEEKGLIERRMLNGNRRSLHIFLTEKGRTYQLMVEQAFCILEEEVFEGISEAERTSFMAVFEKIYGNLVR